MLGMRPFVLGSAGLIWCLNCGAWAGAAALDVNLGFATLPSAQGWRYDVSGSSLTEGQAFSVDGTALHMNTMGSGLGGGSHNYYVHGVTPFTPGASWELDFRVRVPRFESTSSNPAFNPFGFFVGINLDGSGVDIGLTDLVKLGPASGTGNGTVPLPFDTTGWHRYRFVADRTHGIYGFFIDDSLKSSGQMSAALGGFPDGIYVGDATGSENSEAEVSELHAFETTAYLAGDCNLNGRIDPDDFASIDRGFSKHLSGWTNGDFDGNGTVDSADYLAIDRAFSLQGGGAPSADLLDVRRQEFGPWYVSSLEAVLPEPGPWAIFMALAAASAGLGGRK